MNPSALLGIALASLVTASAAQAMPQDKPEKGDPRESVRCYAVNSCKGKSACDTAVAGCAGQNACKGKGFLEMKRSECKKKRGRFADPNQALKKP